MLKKTINVFCLPPQNSKKGLGKQSFPGPFRLTSAWQLGYVFLRIPTLSDPNQLPIAPGLPPMPAPFEARYHYILADLEARFPRPRIGLSISEVATYLSEAYGISDSSELCRRRIHSMETQLGRPVLLGKDLRYCITDLAWDLATGFEESPQSTPMIAARARPATASKPKKGHSSNHNHPIDNGKHRARPSTAGFVTHIDHEGTETLWSWVPEQPIWADLGTLERLRPPSQAKRVKQLRNFWEEVDTELHRLEGLYRAAEREDQLEEVAQRQAHPGINRRHS
jgi:hypothetical protein